MSWKKHIIRTSAALLLALGMACPSPASINKSPNTGAAPAQAAVNAEDQKPEDEVYTYQSSGRRDPFLSLIYEAEAARKKQKNQMRIPIEQYDVDQMALEAIVTGNGIPSYALVRLPNGKHYTLREGSVAGANRGKVVQIAPDHIVVRETVRDLTGRMNIHNVILKLRTEEEKG